MNVPGFIKKELDPETSVEDKNTFYQGWFKFLETFEETEKTLMNEISKPDFVLEYFIQEQKEDIKKLIKFDNLDPNERRFKVVEKIIEVFISKLRIPLSNEKDPTRFFSILFEHFVIFLINYICYFSGLKCNVYYNKILVILEFYGDEETLQLIAEKFNYFLNLKILADLKIYDKTYKKELHDIKDLQTLIYENQMKTLRTVRNINEKNSLQYEQINPEDISYFTPYFKYSDKIRPYFRRYTLNDKYHDCKFAETVNNHHEEDAEKLTRIHECSIFRNIDKLRLIHSSLNFLVDLEEFKSFYFFHRVTFIRNEESYKKDFEGMVRDFLSPSETEIVNRFNFSIRNFFGEKVAYYFVFVSHFMKWMLFPSVFGLFYFFTLKIIYHENSAKKDLNLFRCYLDLSFIFIIIFWAIMYIKSWACNQKYYNFIWGMDEINSHQKQNPKCKIDRAMIYLNVQIPLITTMEKFFKTLFSILVSIVMCLMSILTNLVLFYFFEANVPDSSEVSKLQLGTTKSISDLEVRSDFWYFLIPVLNVVLRNISSFLNYYVSKWVTNYENHTMQSSYEDSMIIKIISFEFVNYYFNLIYIAYFKNYYESCVNNDCFEELGHQLTIIILTSTVFNIVELFFPFLTEIYNKKNFNFVNQEENKRMLNLSKPKYPDYMSHEYINIVLKYGYVILFGIASPSCFFLILVSIWLKRFVDCYKLVYIYNVPMIGKKIFIIFCRRFKRGGNNFKNFKNFHTYWNYNKHDDSI